MSAASNYTEANVINALLRGVTFPVPSATYVSLHTGDQLDYDVNFGQWIEVDDTITSATAIVQDIGTLAVESVQVAEQVVKVWITGGDTGETYSILVTVATANGRVKEAEFKIRVRDC